MLALVRWTVRVFASRSAQWKATPACAVDGTSRRYRQILGDVLRKTKRVQHLAQVFQVNLSWKVDEVSDCQRCRFLRFGDLCRSTSCVLHARDKDLFVREDILHSLRAESEICAAAVFCLGWGAILTPPEWHLLKTCMNIPCADSHGTRVVAGEVSEALSEV